MQKLFAAATLAAISASALALAQTAPPPIRMTGMSAAEVKAALFGIHLYGTTADFGMTWDECIEPGGNTLYTTPGGTMQGRLTVSPRGLACFAYEDDGFKTPECFVVRRNKDSLVLTGEFGGEAFVTTKVVRGIRTCEKQDLIG